MKRVLLSALSLTLVFGWSCQSDKMQEVNPADANGVVLDDAMAAGGNGNGNAYGLLRNCASHAVLERKLQQNPGWARKLQEIEEQARAFTNAKPGNGNGGGNSGGGTTDPDPTPDPTPDPAYTSVSIPVVVHVIWDVNDPRQNISDAQIASQIAALNKDFSAANSDVNNVPAEFAPLVANAQVSFTLAKVNSKSSTKTSWGTNDAMKYSRNGGFDAVAGHLNIWVCNIGGGILGYAQFPGGPSATDGVVVGPNYFGDASAGGSYFLSKPYDKGRTTTHEVGHWLNLRHIWGDGRCSQDDYVADTPGSDRPNYGCPAYPTEHCRSNDMTMNYMDYSDDACMYMFSEGQKARMHSLFAAGGARSNYAN